MTKKRCLFCRQWFKPYAPQARRQLVCARTQCHYRLKLRLNKAWKQSRNAAWREKANRQLRAWAGKKKYWPWYRREHPAYTARDNRRRARALRRERWRVVAQNSNDDPDLSLRETGVVPQRMNDEIFLVDKNASLFRKG